ncbi:phosphotransferase family protein [Occultella gossypii]|uniref:Aminoglycoside phosphotransferase family protein n=1 Tax=Occultella gossypii TaxID=2800820 RepID=A0ABS7S9N8_9MICO|nr:aminoglycoside phosphotransferase family protein [Occultella gossypii]MBZ2197058.1 aminoglycoside phosphotransferase family protein [Occultella gossypii]
MVLAQTQQQTVDRWFPGAEVVADMSWGLVDTVVLHLKTHVGEVVVKAAGPGNHHIGREISGHREWAGPWLGGGHVNRLLHADPEGNVLALSYLPGTLVQGTPAAGDPKIYRQAGELLAAFHGQASTVSEDYEARMDAQAPRWLDGEHRIGAETESDLRSIIATHDHAPAVLVPTHGDWQPRNWLVDDEGCVRVIDLGRAAWRPALTDLGRLARQEWEARPDLEAAFLDGYGGDPREQAAWQRTLVREAIGTAAWAYQVGDEAFEQQGHRMILQCLEFTNA